jgi:hypothetical protein
MGFRMHRKSVPLVLTLVIFSVAACKPKIDDKEAIRAGVIKHLAAMQGLNLQNMDVNVLQATVNGNEAQVQVAVHAKGTDPTTGAMQIGYSMEKQSGEWVVVKSTGMGGGVQHPAPGSAPAGGEMPPGHPGANGSSPQLPAGHPDFSEILKSAPSGTQQPPAQEAPPATGKP